LRLIFLFNCLLLGKLLHMCISRDWSCQFVIFVFIERSIWVFVVYFFFVGCLFFLSSIPVAWFLIKIKDILFFLSDFLFENIGIQVLKENFHCSWLFDITFQRRSYIVVHIVPENSSFPPVNRIHRTKICIIHSYLCIVGSESHTTSVSFSSPFE
jgi:hypothetical protein